MRNANLAMAVTHRANKADELAAASDKTTERSVKLIRLIDSPKMKEQLLAMKEAFEGKPSSYTPFVTQWKYRENPEQVAAGLKAIEEALAS